MCCRCTLGPRRQLQMEFTVPMSGKPVHNNTHCLASIAYIHPSVFSAVDFLHPACMDRQLLAEAGHEAGAAFLQQACYLCRACTSSPALYVKKPSYLRYTLQGITNREYTLSLHPPVQAQPPAPASATIYRAFGNYSDLFTFSTFCYIKPYSKID